MEGGFVEENSCSHHNHGPIQSNPTQPNQGETPEDRQQWRDEVLSTSVGDFKEFGERLADMTKVGGLWFG